MKSIKVVSDNDPESPREWDNLGTMACWHNRYTLGDIQPHEDASEWLQANAPKGSVVLPLYLYDHSGITISTSSFSCRWDSGQIGYIVVTPETIRKEFSVKRISKKLRAKIENSLRNEVKTYDEYLTGNVWGFIVEDDQGDKDSCFGFYGGLKDNGMKENLPKDMHGQLEQAWEARF